LRSPCKGDQLWYSLRAVRKTTDPNVAPGSNKAARLIDIGASPEVIKIHRFFEKDVDNLKINQKSFYKTID
jgi:hypothetical protein